MTPRVHLRPLPARLTIHLAALCSAWTLSFVPTGSAIAAETIVVPYTTHGGVQTVGSYSGLIELEVSGFGTDVPGVILFDAFYWLDPTDPNMPTFPTPSSFRVSRASEGGCTCFVECSGQNHAVAALLTTGHPVFNPSHEYAVTIDLGSGPAEQLTFGIADCGPGNSGSLTVTLTQLPDQLDQCEADLAAATADTDEDGTRDLDDTCPDTIPGTDVDASGCSHEQFCAIFDPNNRDGRRACRKADWQNDEPVMRRRDRDCQVERSAPYHRCVAVP